MIWFLYVIPCLIMVCIGCLFSWLFVLFAKMQDGPINNNNGSSIEPRLLAWLKWFQTADNSLLGDFGWQTKHCIGYWGCYLGMVMWIMRNPAHYFRLNVLGAKVKAFDEKSVYGDNKTSDDEKNFHPGWMFITVGKYWCLYAVIPWSKTRYADIEFGWSLRDYVNEVCPFKDSTHIFSLSPRLFAKKPKAV